MRDPSTLLAVAGQAGSGLGNLRIVIEDGDERYPKVVYQELLSGDKFKDAIYWDGRFADGTIAPAGEYPVTLKVTDQAGNESRMEHSWETEE